MIWFFLGLLLGIALAGGSRGSGRTFRSTTPLPPDAKNFFEVTGIKPAGCKKDGDA